MAILTTNTGSVVGNKPSVLDLVVLQGATDTPLLSSFGKGSVSGIKHSWITDRVRKGDANASLEVSAPTGAKTNTKTAQDNVTQIFTNDVKISYSQDAVAVYGQKELQHQLMKGAKEHALDLEFGLLGLNNTTVYDGYTERTEVVAPKMKGIFGFVPAANKIDAVEASAFDYNALCDILQKVWENGGEANKVYVGAGIKKIVNGFGDSYLNVNNGDQKFDPRVTRVMTDFGIVEVMLHRYFNATNGLGDTVLAGDFSDVSFKSLINTKLEDVPTDETATVKRYYTEGTLEVKNPDSIACGFGYTNA